MKSRIRRGFGKAHGTFGELLQGELPEANSDFLITFPIQAYTYAEVSLSEKSGAVVVCPEEKRKTQDLVSRLASALGSHCRGLVELSSGLPIGKGFASSSADMVAAARAFATAAGERLSTELLCELLSQIEPTDGVMFDEFVAFYHKRCRLVRRLGLPRRPLSVLAVDEGGKVDTIAFNRHRGSICRSERHIYEGLLRQAQSAIENDDPMSLGDVATQSALLHQSRLQKESLVYLQQLKSDVKALGVIVTHSGSCAGLIFEADDRGAFDWAWDRLKGRGWTPARYDSLYEARA